MTVASINVQVKTELVVLTYKAHSDTEASARGSYAPWRSVAGRSRFCTYPASASCAASAIQWPMQVSERIELNALYAGVRRFVRDWEGVRS